jgi:signal transduction histidine kinase
VPVALARVQPVVTALLVAGAMFLTMLAGARPPLAGLVALVAVVYVVGRRRSRRATVLILTPFLLYAVAPLSAADVLLVLTSVAALVGVAGQAREETAGREASSRALEGTLVEHAARGERARIARELHDVVAHHVSMIAVQAEAARLATPGLPAEGVRRLTAIGDTARTALTEMRRLLGVLRVDTAREEATREEARRPQPGLQQLNELLDEARDSSLSGARLIVRGRVAPLEPGIELTAYRIVQEALTNVRRHAPGAAVDVELDYREDALHLWVRDNGPGPSSDEPPGSGGHGLAGMRERAAMVGGRLSTGPAPLGGFLVEAVLPSVSAVSGVEAQR